MIETGARIIFCLWYLLVPFFLYFLFVGGAIKEEVWLRNIIIPIGRYDKLIAKCISLFIQFGLLYLGGFFS